MLVLPIQLRRFGPRATRGLGLVAVGAVVWLAALLWLRPLSDPDEGRYAVVALHMLQSGDWVIPRLNGLPFFHKPPLYYWLAAAGFQVFGVHEWVARLPSLLGACLASISLWVLLRSDRGLAFANAAVIVLLTMPFMYLAAQYANMDMLLAGCVSACICSAVLATREQPERRNNWLVAAGVFAGLGFLAKGLIAIVLPGMVWALWLVWDRRIRQWWLPLHPAAWLPVCVLAGPWVWLVQQRYPQFLHYFFITQHFERYTQTGFNNPQPWWFYLVVIAVACLPWTLVAAVLRFRQWCAHRRSVSRSDTGDAGDTRSLDRLMLVWWVVVLLFFSLPRSKIVGYVLPALPAMAYGIVRGLASGFGGSTARDVRAHRIFLVTAYAAASICLLSTVYLGSIGVPAKARWQALRALPSMPADRMVMVGHLYYEAPFYMQTQQPALLINDWRGLEAAGKNDNWMHEISDAATFDTQSARHMLLDAQGLAAYRCAHPAQRLWLIGERAVLDQLLPAVAMSKPALMVGQAGVWLLPAADNLDGFSCHS